MKLWKSISVAAFYAVSLNINAATILQDDFSITRQILVFSDLGQSFTAEDENILSIGFYVEDINQNSSDSFDLSLQLFEGVGFVGSSLGAVDITLEDGFNGFADFDFSFVTLNVGSVYSAQISSTSARGGLQSNQHSFPSGAPINGNDYIGGDYIMNGEVDVISDARFRVTAVPLPAAVWLLGSGLIGLAGIARRKKV